MHTLEQLRTGQLIGAKEIRIHNQLTEFPMEILALADTLELLDLSQNQLTQLPDELACLTKLKILFASDNQFDHLPEVLGRCPQLEMIGFKSNHIKTVSNDAIPSTCRWLILTNNQIAQLPSSLGQCPRLQKLALAGNQLTSLPQSMADCHNLELIRLSANQLPAIPDFLWQLPKLSWLAIAGNPCTTPLTQASKLTVVDQAHIRIGAILGQGASGVIYQGQWQQTASAALTVAIKIFKGEVTSDGYPEDELSACLQAGRHPNLINTLASLDSRQQSGVILSLVPSSYSNLGLPPSLASCTRDTFCPSLSLSQQTVHQLLLQGMDVINHLHQQGLCHGDIYAHNMLVNNDGHLLLGDMGAATPLQALSTDEQRAMQAIEVRAIGCVIDDLLSLCPEAMEQLIRLRDDCWQPMASQRPTLATLQEQLQTWANH
ncbi:leucine-rich repeat-containing protein kinase family protein [Shewanella sp. NIFS-20-20]|uniref:leucine-rich repeat-containing protein kinase family protein n=1 Tax=Shewanella sp. NIFS-20-20 TaxID=2853806 RepID=UPI001C453598|nr:leucine-rich repeat-containing protein kinase family protein [Shewanella sp. NIFS-20-20]MBV7317177.1 leucine-rich repeat-containing serine/threonine-protein kinase [Shewanella sp. NIFS-20-20]